jgi:hypothetical protein
MRTSVAVLAVIILSLMPYISISAENERWEFLMGMKDGSNWYYDSASIVRYEKVAEVWVKNAKTVGEKSFLCSLAIDCSKRKWRASEFHYYDESSDTYKLDKGVTEIAEKEGWKRIVPGSYYEALHDIVCR